MIQDSSRKRGHDSKTYLSITAVVLQEGVTGREVAEALVSVVVAVGAVVAHQGVGYPVPSRTALEGRRHRVQRGLAHKGLFHADRPAVIVPVTGQELMGHMTVGAGNHVDTVTQFVNTVFKLNVRYTRFIVVDTVLREFAQYRNIKARTCAFIGSIRVRRFIVYSTVLDIGSGLVLNWESGISNGLIRPPPKRLVPVVTKYHILIDEC